MITVKIGKIGVRVLTVYATYQLASLLVGTHVDG